MKRSLALIVVLHLFCVVIIGCGGSETTVVQPGADYQLTEEEKQMKAEIDAVPPPGT